jgi:hypothetical protein
MKKVVLVAVGIYAVIVGLNTHTKTCGVSDHKDVVKVDFFPGQSMLWVDPGTEGTYPKFISNDNVTKIGWELLCY